MTYAPSEAPTATNPATEPKRSGLAWLNPFAKPAKTASQATNVASDSVARPVTVVAPVPTSDVVTVKKAEVLVPSAPVAKEQALEATPTKAAVANRTGDILLTPEKFNPTTDPVKAKSVPAPAPVAVAKTTPAAAKPKAPATGAAKASANAATASAQARTKTETASTVAKAAPAPAAPSEKSPPATRDWPLGSQSVLAARSGIPAQIALIPVPIATVPQPLRPPMPPDAKVPEAPQPTAYVNAFTPPPQPQTQAAPPATGAFAMPPAPYGMVPTANPYYAAQMNAYAQQMAANQAYAQQMANYAYSQQLANYASAQQARGAMAMNASAYANPYAAGVSPVAYAAPAAPPYNPAAAVEQLTRVLRESPYPSQREWAALSLTSLDVRAHGLAVPALLQAATQDPAPTVRAGSVQCLARLSITPESYLGALQPLRNDADPQVRQVVEQILARPGQARVSVPASR
jgi:hypothetical protein